MVKRTLFFNNPVRLKTQLEQLVIEYPEYDGEKPVTKTVPIEDIGVIIIDNPQVSLTAVLMQKLMANNSIIITCDDRHMPQGCMIPFEGNTLVSERYKLQFNVSEPLKKQLWQQTIVAKIRNQAAVLECSGIDAKPLQIWANEVLSGDSKNHEGIAAAWYFNTIFSHFITKFKRSREGDAPNNVLNYTYAIIRAMVARAIVGAGLLPALGIHHRNKYNAFCLADDIMEPFRPFADRLVLDLIKQEEDISTLTVAIKAKLINIASVDVLINGERAPLMNAIQRTVDSLIKCYSNEKRKLELPNLIK